MKVLMSSPDACGGKTGSHDEWEKHTVEVY